MINQLFSTGQERAVRDVTAWQIAILHNSPTDQNEWQVCHFILWFANQFAKVKDLSST